MNLILDNKVYDVLKWIVLIALPAISALYAALSQVWGWGYIEQVTITIGAIELFLGSLIGISSSNYKKEVS